MSDEVDGESSKESTKFRANAGSTDGIREDPDDVLFPLREEYTNAKKRISQQTVTFRAFAKEGQSMLRIILLFVGLLITALSALGPEAVQQSIGSSTCAVQFTTGDECFHMNTITIVSGISLAASAVAHAWVSGNEARAVGVIGTSDDIRSAVNGDLSKKAYLNERLKRYHDRVDRNDRYLEVIESFLMWGKIALLVSILSLTVVIVAIVTKPISGWLILLCSFVAVLILLLLRRALPDAVISADSPF